MHWGRSAIIFILITNSNQHKYYDNPEPPLLIDWFFI
nr:MAG TPA: hypothetical protein [Caudoviricetes sp.]